MEPDLTQPLLRPGHLNFPLHNCKHGVAYPMHDKQSLTLYFLRMGKSVIRLHTCRSLADNPNITVYKFQK